MCGDHDGEAVSEVRLDLGLPVRQHPRDDVLEALRARHGVAQARIARVTGLGVLVVGVDGRRRHVVRATPLHELLLAELLEDLLLVLALQRAVVALVETPAALDRDPVAVGGVEREVRGGDGPPLHRRVHDVRQDRRLLELLAGADRLGPALLRQVDVDPAGEEVLRVPVALAVPDEHQGVGHGRQPSDGHLPVRKAVQRRPRAGDGTARGCASTHHGRRARPTPSSSSRGTRGRAAR